MFVCNHCHNKGKIRLVSNFITPKNSKAHKFGANDGPWEDEEPCYDADAHFHDAHPDEAHKQRHEG